MSRDLLSELGFLGLRGFLGLGKNWGTDMWNADGQDAGPLPRTPPAVASLPRPAVGHLGFAKGTVLSEPRITQMDYDGPRPFVGFHPHSRFKPGAGSSPLPSRERGRRCLNGGG